MMRIFGAARALAALLLLVSWTTAGWAAACALPAAGEPMAMHGAMHHGAHHAIHHPSPPPERSHRGGDGPECPLLAMNGGSCLSAAQLAGAPAAPPPALAEADAYPPAAGVRDRLLPFSFFHPPRG